MEKLSEFSPDIQSVEDWLEGFEARADCLGVPAVDKLRWCRSVIGGVGRKILKNLRPRANWDDAKKELRRFLGEEDTRDGAWKKLKQYKAEGKSFGEIASDLLNLAKMASGEDDVQQRMAIEAFIEAIPWRYASEIRKKRIERIEDALKEVKLLKTLEEEENRRRRPEILQQRVDVPINQRGDYRDSRPWKKKENRTLREGNSQGRYQPLCWGCGKKGHILKDCSLFQEFRRQQCECPAEEEANVQIHLN